MGLSGGHKFRKRSNLHKGYESGHKVHCLIEVNEMLLVRCQCFIFLIIREMFMQVSDPKQIKPKVATSLESDQFMVKLKQNRETFFLIN